jgi:hypothetical protein
LDFAAQFDVLDVKAIHLPSGDHCGFPSGPGFVVNLRDAPPAEGTT